MDIMIVEDEPIIRKELKILLENSLYNVTTLDQYKYAAGYIIEQKPDLVLLDLNLPGVSGFDICMRVREKSDVPIVFLTSRTDSMDELNGMLKGGDDYITKPYQAPILLARIAAVLKRTYTAPKQDIFVVKEVKLNILKASISYGDKNIDLTKNELKILYCLFQHEGEIVSRMELVEYLWENQVFIDDNTLSVNVTRIREKLRDIGISDFIETKRGMGYCI